LALIGVVTIAIVSTPGAGKAKALIHTEGCKLKAAIVIGRVTLTTGALDAEVIKAIVAIDILHTTHAAQ
jgi:hypothetical protein